MCVCVCVCVCVCIPILSETGRQIHLSLKLVDKFTYLENSVSSTEKDIDTRLTKAMDSYR